MPSITMAYMMIQIIQLFPKLTENTKKMNLKKP